MPTITAEPVRGNPSLPRLRTFTPRARITSVSAPPNPHSTRWECGRDDQASCLRANPPPWEDASPLQITAFWMATFPDERGQGTTCALSVRFDFPAPNGLQRVPPRHAAETAGACLLEAHLRARCWAGVRIRETTRRRPNRRPNPLGDVHIHVAAFISRPPPKLLTQVATTLTLAAEVHRPRNCALRRNGTPPRCMKRRPPEL